ncbi:MAG TPA: hypothetical protein PK673_02070 [Paludibacteraceae bacterium]|nr:hypothetical protein [Paludibacteraceae bacterium]HPD27140.1 hypothetical protein [Paludibacteraceae bacterium]HRR58863.1 hypothetical protein [Paludibacteraceae bacterium]HRU72343.1 hypothetical protein [Paludibacteraceae bacterium]
MKNDYKCQIYLGSFAEISPMAMLFPFFILSLIIQFLILYAESFAQKRWITDEFLNAKINL